MRPCVVVVAHNEGDELPATVDAMLATTPADTEIIVVDDQSDDGSPERVQEAPGLTVLRTTARGGVTGSRNFGAAAATGDVLIFSDGHVRTEPNWLEGLMAGFEDPAVGAAAPVVSSLDGTGYPGYGFTWRSPKLGTAWLTKPAERPEPVPMLCGCFMAVRRTTFEGLGGFDAGLTLWGMEDAELSLCVWRLGLECRVVPTSRIRHKFRKTFPYNGVNWAMTLANTLRVATVHLPQPAMARVFAHYAAHPQFPEAAERLADSDAFARRTWMDAEAEHDGAWFIDRFEIEALR